MTTAIVAAMTRSKSLGIVAVVLWPIAAVNCWLAWMYYAHLIEGGASAADARESVQVWTILAFMTVAGAILSTVGAFALREDHSSGGGQSSSGSGAGSGASGDL